MRVKRLALAGHRGHMDKFARMITSYPESEVASVWDNDIPAGRALAAQYQVPFHENYDELIADPGVDAVILCTDNEFTPKLALAAVNAGKSLYVEKPLCLDPADARAIRDAVNAKRVTFFMTDPFVESSTIWAKQFIASGALGRLLSVHIRFVNSSCRDWITDEKKVAEVAAGMHGGMMSDTGNHPLHVLTYLLGKPEKIYGRMLTVDPLAEKYGYDQMSFVVASYPDNVTATLEIGCVAPSYTNCIEVCGTRGTIIDETLGRNMPPQIRYALVPEDEPASYSRDPARSVGRWVTLGPDKLPEAPDDHIRYFVRMLAENIPNEMVGADPKSTHGVSIDGAVDLVEISDAFHRSAAEGREICLT